MVATLLEQVLNWKWHSMKWAKRRPTTSWWNWNESGWFGNIISQLQVIWESVGMTYKICKKHPCCFACSVTDIYLEISSFSKSVPKTIIICYTVLETWYVFHFGLIFALLHPPLQPEKWKLKKMIKTSGDIIILHKCTKNHDHMLLIVQVMSKGGTENPGFHYWLVSFNNIAINWSQCFTNNLTTSIVYSCQCAWVTLQLG